MRLGLTGRILLAGGIVVAVLLVRFVLLVHSFHSVRDATDADERAERSVFAAQRLEKLVLDLETGTRGYVITRDPAFLEPWRVGAPGAAGAVARADGGRSGRAVAAHRRGLARLPPGLVDPARLATRR